MAAPKLTAEQLRVIHEAIQTHCYGANNNSMYCFSAAELENINDYLETCGVQVDLRPVQVEIGGGGTSLSDIQYAIQNGFQDLIRVIKGDDPAQRPLQNLQSAVEGVEARLSAVGLHVEDAAANVSGALALMGLEGPAKKDTITPEKARSGASQVYLALLNKPEVMDALLPLLKESFEKYEEELKRKEQIREALMEANPPPF